MKGQDPRYGGIISSVTSGIADLARRNKPIGHLWEGDRLDGRTCLVTGASSGLGFAVACELRRRGARVVVASRTAGPELEERLRSASDSRGSPAGAGTPDSGTEPGVVAESLDLSRFDSVTAFVQRLADRGEDLDIIVSNAGVVTAGSRETGDGYDEMLQVNYLSTYLLIRKLVEGGRVTPGAAGAPGAATFNRNPRIIFISSEVHRSAPDVDAEAPFTVPPYTMSEALRYYGYSKLLLTTFSEELSRRLNGGNGGDGGTGGSSGSSGASEGAEGSERARISVFAMCPGAMNTNIAREAPAVFRPLLGAALAVFFRSPEKAAEPVIYLASSPDMEGTTGLYLHLMSEKEKDARARDPELGRRLWESSERALARYFEG